VTWEQVEAEAAAILEAAAGHARVVGSAGIRMHCERARGAMEALSRPCKDLDLVVRSGARKTLRSALEKRGYVIDRDLLVAMEGQRFAFRHADTGLDIDVFVDKLAFCHTLELDGRWERHPTTLPVEDLLLQKLQVHEPTETDVMDAAVVLATHGVGSGDPERIDAGYVAGVLASDWGFHRDATANLDRVVQAAPQLGLAVDVGPLQEVIAGARKSMSWRMRARVGERMQWWEDVSEREDTY
jgi:hypothetical protein